MVEEFKEYKKLLKLPVFDYKFLIVYTNDFDKSINSPQRIRLMRLKEPYECLDKSFQAIHFAVASTALSVIFVPLDADINQVSHEAYHAISRLMRFIGAKPEEEIVAYHLDWLIGEMCKIAKKADKKFPVGVKDESKSPPKLSKKEYDSIVKKFEKRVKDKKVLDK